jgi:hypothetical protein
MRLRQVRDDQPPERTRHSAWLRDMTPMHVDDETRATGEDLRTYSRLPENYVRPVALPRWLTGHPRRRPAKDRSA